MQTEPDAPPGTLTGIMYSYPGGMEARSDFCGDLLLPGGAAGGRGLE